MIMISYIDDPKDRICPYLYSY